MELKEAFKKSGKFTLRLGFGTYTIEGTTVHITVKVPKLREPFDTIVGVADMQTIPIQTLMGYGMSMEYATILQWLCTRYIQDVYPELA